MKQYLVDLKHDVPVSTQMGAICADYSSGQYKSLLIHIFSGISDEEYLLRLVRELRECCGTDLIVGTMSAGEIKDGKVMPQGVLISAMLFETSAVQIIRYDNVKGHEVETGIGLCQRLNSIPDIKGVELLFPGTKMDTQQMFAEIGRCNPGIQIFGGYPGGHKPNSPEHFIFDTRDVMYNALLAVTYSGVDLHFNMNKTLGWVPVGMPFKITKADGKHLIELNGKPAAEVYEKFLQIDRKLYNNAEEALEFPLLAHLDGDHYLRSVDHIEEDGSIWMHGFTNEDMDVQLTYGDPTRIVEMVNQRLEEMRLFRPQAILLYSCIVRKFFWESFTDMEMEPFARIASTAGFHTWGEVLRNTQNGYLGENNITLLSIGIREGEAPADELPPIRVDDTVLQGQASVLRRMSRLVYTSMEELQRAHNKLTYLAEHDTLTGLYNRGTIEKLIDGAMDKGLTSLVMADLDHFKRVNDNHGHDVGDTTLREIADILAASIKSYPGAYAGRWGGEEFFVMLPGIDESKAMVYANNLRHVVDHHIFPTIGHLTISQGVITVRNCSDYKIAYKNVDDALYTAKDNGRNRVVQAESL